jgi:hypothetical protein
MDQGAQISVSCAGGADLASSLVEADPEESLRLYKHPSHKERKCRSRTILSKEQVIEIFEHKPSMESADRFTAPSVDLARKYHVSSKTIRDIWNGRSWNGTTRPLQKQVQRPDSRYAHSQNFHYLTILLRHCRAAYTHPMSRRPAASRAPPPSVDVIARTSVR